MKTKGSKDKVLKRKTRKDKGKKRKVYRGVKPKKHFKKVSKRTERKSVLKIYIWEQTPMSKAGYYKWKSKTRHNVKKIVYKPFRRIDVKVELINTKENIERFFIDEVGQAGVFILRAFSGGKNKFRIKQVRLGVCTITEHPEGLRAKFIPTFRLNRFGWFYRG